MMIFCVNMFTLAVSITCLILVFNRVRSSEEEEVSDKASGSIRGKFILEDIELPENYEPCVTLAMLSFFGTTMLPYIIYEDLRITRNSVQLLLQDKYVTIGCVKDGKIAWDNIPESLKDTVKRIIYSCEKIMEAELSNANKKFYEDEERIITDHQGVKVIKRR